MSQSSKNRPNRSQFESTKGSSRRSSPLLPIFGLIIVIAAGALGWFLAPSVIDFLAERIPNFTGNELNATVFNIIVAGIVAALAFLVFLIISSLVIRPGSMESSEKQMAREKEARIAAEKAEKERLRRRQR